MTEMAAPLPSREYYLCGVAPILGASAVWAFAYMARKMIMGDVTPVTLAFINAVIVVAFFIVVFRPDVKTLAQALRAHFWRFLLLALNGAVLGTVCMFYALDHLDLGVTTLLEKLQPLFTIVLASVALNEKFPRRLYPACAVALVSSYFVAAPDPLALDFDGGQKTGLLAVLGAAFFWACSGILGKSLVQEGYRSRDLIVLRFTLGALLLLPVVLFEGGGQIRLDYSPAVWAAMAATAIISTGFGYILYYRGLKHVTASTSAFLELATPLISVALGLAVLGETLSWTQVAAMPALVYAVYKISAAEK